MRRISIAFGLTALAVLLHGCGGGGAGDGAGIVATERVAYVRVIDPATGNPVAGAEVYFVTDTGNLPLRRVVATATSNPNEIPLSVARAIKSNAREGDFLLRNVGDDLVFRGLWVRRPAGYTAVVRHTTPDNIKRVIQTPDSPTTLAACLIASNQAGVVRTVFGAPRVIDFGTLELFPNNPQVPPPPVDDVCP
ncbi:MAG: hypothetical protein KatS3mg018_1462 [Fimbriimonadales bacterium]|nr:MAG: hypothetical protein KatS3mg018_1462 [Fimbriimonadales bacterium]